MEGSQADRQIFENMQSDYLTVLKQIDIPLAVYQFVDHKVVTIFISDALMKCFGHGIENRDEMVAFYNEDMYRYVHKDDRERIMTAARDFAMGRSHTYDVVYKEQLPVRMGWSMIHARGYHHTMQDGIRYAIVYYDDVTAAHEMNRAQAELMQHTFFESLRQYGEAISIFDSETHEVFYSNERMREVFPPPAGYQNGVTIEEYLGIGTFPYSVAEILEHGKFSMMLPDPERALIFRASPTEWRGRPACVLVLSSHDDERFVDELTALPSLNYLRVHGEKEIRSLAQGPKAFSVLFFDICEFKQYNHIFGYEAGDTLLKQCADIIRNHFKGEFICRFYDDHFVVLSTQDKLYDLVAAVRRDLINVGFGTTVQLKVGIYEMNDLGESIISACEKARIARKWIQFEQGEFCIYYEPKMQEMDNLQHYVALHIDEAIDNGWIEVYYQPVGCSLFGKICGFEALARWNDPVRGILQPGVFIGALENSHQIHKLDSYMILQICKEMRCVLNEGKTVVPVSFNLSRLDFISCDIFEIVENAVRMEKIDRSMLHIEITESIFATDAYIKEQVVRFLQAGYEVWMDDFGSGYSSLNVLKDYDFDALKIDMVFLSKFDQRSKDIIRAIVAMAKELGVRTLAEGVETSEQLEFLRSIGCEMVQGYLLGRPKPLHQMIADLKSQSLSLVTREERDFYLPVGRLDFMTDRSMAILLYDGYKQHFLFANDSFRQALADIGVTSLRDAELHMNDPHLPIGRMYRGFAERAAGSGEEEEFTYVVSGKFMRLSARSISKLGDMHVFVDSLETMTVHADTARQVRFNSYLAAMALSYDEVNLIHFDEDYAENIINRGEFCEDTNARHDNLLESRNHYANMFIYPEDISGYLAFSDPKTLVQRIREEETGYVSGEFRRRRTMDAPYVWTHYTELLMPHTGGQVVMELIRKAPREGNPRTEG